MNSNSRSSSISAINPQTSHHTSVTSRLSFAVSSAERGEAAEGANAAAAEHHQIEEEIAEIKRYEVGRLGPSTVCCWRRFADSVLGFYDNRCDLCP